MKTIIFLLIISTTLFSQRIYEPKTGGVIVDSLVASAAVDTIISTEIFVGRWKGDVTLAISPVENSGTATAVTITYAVRFIDFNYGDYQTLATLTAADQTAGTDNYMSLTNSADWKWVDYVRIRFISASGTYNVSLEYQVKGQ